MRRDVFWYRMRYFFMGVLLTLGGFLMIGASSIDGGTLLASGRYRVATWGYALGETKGHYGAFLVDTSNGNTKIIYSAMFDDQRENVLVNLLGKPFYYGESFSPDNKRKPNFPIQ